ncbi:hypothetical protein BCV69DRAFT_278069 [Microstroma glucosiphilum]|uniref:HTH CENPB-type domain-containing protein n=1 Tax=Pseudomicrostroma glucosiphilum TaxID=1684307 RepID=A0A316U4R1_9BASI|nr:hypothetical protein BCV69DRAFT_278069 [Pseudomicrostroma glucosiphilum]PWN19814.1 hypothetical protein BCV69DRAFT_278069 [Pseudomicrostroma glucosiphilum]
MPVTRANTVRGQGLVEEAIQQVDSQGSSTEVADNLASWYPPGPNVDQLIAGHQAPTWSTVTPLELADSRRSTQDSQHYASLARPASSQALQLDIMRQLQQSSPQSKERDWEGASRQLGNSNFYAPSQDTHATMQQMIHMARHPFGLASSTHMQDHSEAGVNLNVSFPGQSNSPQGSAAMYALCSEPSRGLYISSSDSPFQPIAQSHGHSRHASFDHMTAARHQQEQLLRLQTMTPIRRIDQPYLTMSAPGHEKRLIGPSSAPLSTGPSSRMSSDRAAFLRTLSSGHPFMSSPPSPGQSLVSPSTTPSSVFQTRDADSARHSPVTPASFGDMTRFFGPPSTMASSSNSMSLDESFTSSSGTDRLSRASSIAKDSEGGVKRVEVRRLQGKKRLTVGDRKLVCLRHLENPTQKQEQLAREFGVERSTVSKILKEKEKWLSMPEDSPLQPTAARSRPPKWPVLEQQLGDWMFEVESQGSTVTDSTIREKALEMAQTLYGDIGNFKGSQGWIEKFKERAALSRHGSVSLQEDSGVSKTTQGKVAGAAASSAPPRRHRKTRTTAAAARHQHHVQGGAADHPACGVHSGPGSNSQPIPPLPAKRPHNAITSRAQPTGPAEELMGALKHEDFFHLPESPIVEPAKRRRRLNGPAALSERARINIVESEQENRSGLTGQNAGPTLIKLEQPPAPHFDATASSTFAQAPSAAIVQTSSRRVLRPRNKDPCQRVTRVPSSAPGPQHSQKQGAGASLSIVEGYAQGSTGAVGSEVRNDVEPQTQAVSTSSNTGSSTLQQDKENVLATGSRAERTAGAWSDLPDSSTNHAEHRVPFPSDLPAPSATHDSGKDEAAQSHRRSAASASNNAKKPCAQMGQASSISLLQARSSLEVVIRYLSQTSQGTEQHESETEVGAGLEAEFGAGAGVGAGAGKEFGPGWVHHRHFLSMGSLQSTLEGLIDRETGKEKEGAGQDWRGEEEM